MEACARNLSLPTLLVRGGLSDILSEEGAREFVALCPRAEYVNVTDAGHMVAGDRNDIFANAVIEFLSRTVPIGKAPVQPPHKKHPAPRRPAGGYYGRAVRQRTALLLPPPPGVAQRSRVARARRGVGGGGCGASIKLSISDRLALTSHRSTQTPVVRRPPPGPAAPFGLRRSTLPATRLRFATPGGREG